MKSSLLSIIFGIMGYLTTLSGQTSHYPYVNYTIKDGLPSNEVYDVIQDKRGYMWFATDNGLCRFDGYSFKKYGIRQGLTDRVVFDLQEDKYGRIWMNSLSRKFFYFDVEKDSIIYTENVNRHLDSINTLKKCFYYNRSKDEMTILNKLNEIQIFKNNIFQYKFESSNNVFYLNGDGKFIEISSLLSPDITIFHYPGMNDSFQYHIDFRLTGKPLNLYAKINKGFLITYEKASVFVLPNSQIETIVGERIEDFEYQSDSSVIVTYRYNKGVWTYKNFEDFKIGKGNQIIGNISATSSCYDKQGNLWICSHNKGVFKTKTNDKIRKYNLFKELQGESIKKAIYFNKYFYLFLSNGDVYQYQNNFSASRKLNSFKLGEMKDVFLFNNEIFGINVINNVGKIALNMQSIDYNTISFRNSTLVCNTFYIDKEKYIYSLSLSGITKHKQNGEKVSSIKQLMCTSMIELKNGKKYVGTVSGLFTYSGSSLIRVPEVDTIFHSRIDYLFELPDTSIIIASKSGNIIQFKKGLIKEVSFDLDEDENISKILSYKNEIWIISSKSISCTVKTGTQFKKYRLEKNSNFPEQIIVDLIVDNNIIYIFFEDQVLQVSRELFFQSIHGLTPEVFIESFRVNNVIHVPNFPLKLSNYENNISFGLLAINHNMKGDIQYQYSLNGGKYFDINKSRVLNFYQLNPGKYKFSFRAKNEDGIWSVSKSITMEILPPWWKTTQFYLGLIIIMGVTIYYIVSNRNKSIKTKNAIKEEIYNLERAALQAQMNPHFIFNSLNSIQKYILANDKIEASEYLAQFAKLIRLNLKASSSSKILLSDELNLLELYLLMEKLRFKDKFTFEILADQIFEIKDKVEIPPMLIQPLIENAIVHGIANCEGMGKISVHFLLEGNKLHVKVTDNGRGLDFTSGKKGHESVGSKITKRRLELISSEMGSNLSIKNILDLHGKVCGVASELTIELKTINEN